MFLKIVYIVGYMKNMAYELVVPQLPTPEDQMMVFRLHLVPLLPAAAPFWIGRIGNRGEEGVGLVVLVPEL